MQTVSSPKREMERPVFTKASPFIKIASLSGDSGKRWRIAQSAGSEISRDDALARFVSIVQNSLAPASRPPRRKRDALAARQIFYTPPSPPPLIPTILSRLFIFDDRVRNSLRLRKNLSPPSQKHPASRHLCFKLNGSSRFESRDFDN